MQDIQYTFIVNHATLALRLERRNYAKDGPKTFTGFRVVDRYTGLYRAGCIDTRPRFYKYSDRTNAFRSGLSNSPGHDPGHRTGHTYSHKGILSDAFPYVYASRL